MSSSAGSGSSKKKSAAKSPPKAKGKRSGATTRRKAPAPATAGAEAGPPADPAPTFRALAGALARFSDFDAFLDGLDRVVADVGGYRGQLERVTDTDPEVRGERFAKGDLIVPVVGRQRQPLHLRFAGAAERRPFDARDLDLLGSLGSLVSALVAQAGRFVRASTEAGLLRFLLDQLPVGIVCLDGEGRFLAGNAEARRLLPLETVVPGSVDDGLRAAFGAPAESAGPVHIEVDGRLIAAEARVSTDGVHGKVVAYVLYDLSDGRERLAATLERELFRHKLRSRPLSFALLRDNGGPGALYRRLSESADAFGLAGGRVFPVDAFTCACIYPDCDARSVRRSLRGGFGGGTGGLTAAVTPVDTGGGGDFDPAALIETAGAGLAPLETALSPVILVLDAYRPVFEALALALEPDFDLRYHPRLADFEAAVLDGQADGLVLDVDGFGREELVASLWGMRERFPDLRCIYTTYRQPEMVKAAFGLKSARPVLQKPFEADRLRAGFEAAFTV